jgi:hypothetical protein
MKAPLAIRIQPRSNRDKTLVLLLRLTALAMLSALLFCFCPFAWMDTIHQRAGMGPLPNTPIIQYLTRSLSGMYAYLGLLLWYLSLDIRRHRGALLFLAISGMFFSVGIIFLDSACGMPLLWTISEGPMTIILCGILLALILRMRG